MSPFRVRPIVAGAGLGAAGLLAYQVARYKTGTQRRFDLLDPPPPGSPEFARLVSAMAGAPLRPGNGVVIMRNGTTLGAMLEAISSAKATIDLSSYIYWPGDIADRFSDALIERADAGVEVNVVLDGYGSAKLDGDRLDRLERSAVNIAIFRPPSWYQVRKLNNRMHRRILVVDGTLGFVGGVGIADVWTGDADDPSHWRETHLRVEGPAVTDLLGAFLENWTEATSGLLSASHVPEIATFDGDGVSLQVTRSTPTGGPIALTQLFYFAIAGARERLWMTTAYFAPDRAFEDVLCAAAERGVDVCILVNGQQVDKEVARKAGHRSYEKLLEAGARMYEYDKTMLHAKVLLVDGCWANVGSGNFDSRSFDLDLEINAAIFDRGLVEELETHFREDLGVSREIELETWRKRPVRQRVAELATELTRQSL
ncbi:MAG TPA: phospholipase D-like domain-containing protein [Acidimicrobiales bacterium]|nr:phospholipase D-like domain-containing protein [Acidimicrobiales bacterium]